MYTQLFKHGSTDGRPTPKIAVLQPAHQTIVWPSKYQEQLVSLHMISPNAVIRTTRAGGRFLRRVISKDISNYVTFGSGAPRLYERIWVDPRMCRSMTTEFQWDDFGTVVGGDWDLNTAPLLQALQLHTGATAYLGPPLASMITYFKQLPSTDTIMAQGGTGPLTTMWCVDTRTWTRSSAMSTSRDGSRHKPNSLACTSERLVASSSTLTES